MVHMIRMLKCKKGHKLNIDFDSNECGCHHNGDPCLILSCNTCLMEEIEKKDEERKDFVKVSVPISKETLEELKALQGTGNE